MSNVPVNFDFNSHDRKLTQLITRIKQGDESAFAAFYELTFLRIYRLALFVLNDPAIAEEVTLDVYLQIWQQANQFDPSRGKPMAWVAILTRSRSLDRLRTCHKTTGCRQFLEEVNLLQTHRTNIEISDASSDQIQVIEKALASLSPEQREAIVMSYFNGLSQREIAIKIDKPLGTVKTRIRLGMINLRKILGPLDERYLL